VVALEVRWYFVLKGTWTGGWDYFIGYMESKVERRTSEERLGRWNLDPVFLARYYSLMWSHMVTESSWLLD